MTKRITNADLEFVVRQINEALGQPTEPYTRDENGKFQSVAGVYTLGGAYGGVRLERIANSGGGVHTITHYDTKRNTYNAMRSMLAGIYAAQRIAEEV